jgi:hypothetical protein
VIQHDRAKIAPIFLNKAQIGQAARQPCSGDVNLSDQAQPARLRTRSAK